MTALQTLRTPRSILVVNSDPDVLALITAILEGPNNEEKPRLRVLRARNTRELLDVLSRPYVPVDLVLANRTLPEPDGGSVAELIGGVRPQLPVMYMSAVSEEQMVRIHGMDDDRGLLRAVVAALEPPRLGRAASIN